MVDFIGETKRIGGSVFVRVPSDFFKNGQIKAGRIKVIVENVEK